ncbi:MAG: GIY-YIG nuclease family protein [Candidatus Thorarchaeota archaeon]
MVKEEKKPYGYIYIVMNNFNGKNYIGKTEKTPEERWKNHLKDARALERAREANPYKKISGTHLNNSFNKFGSEAFSLKQIDVAYSLDELNKKERHYVKEYDSMNPDKGYNMREGGEGAKPRPEVIEKITEISREKAKDSSWLNNMTEINQEIARNPEIREKLSESILKKWQDQQYQDNVSKGATNKWQETKHRERQFKSRVEGKREIPDKSQFLKDIQNMKKKELIARYDMDGKSINVRIKEMLGHRGINNFSEAKKYLENKSLDEVLKDVNAKQNEKPKESMRKKVISNTREFLEDVQNMTLKDIAQKYEMHQNTLKKRIGEMLGDKRIKNYTELRNYLQDKNLDEVIKGIEEKLKDQSHITDGNTIISDKKQFLKDIQELQKNELDIKYRMDAKTVNSKIQELLGEYGVKNYTGAKEYLQDKSIDDVLKDIESRIGEKQDTSIENKNREKREEIWKDSTQKEGDENQSEEKGKEISAEPGEESTEKIQEKISDESIGEQTEDISTGEKSERGEVQNVIMKSEKQLETTGMRRVSTILVPVPDIQPGCQGLLPPGGDNDNRGKSPREKREREYEPHRFTFTSGEKQGPPFQRSFRDYAGIDESPKGKKFDYEEIDRHFEDGKSDIKSLDRGHDEQSSDYEGIDKPQESGDKDYDKIDESYGEGGYEG